MLEAKNSLKRFLGNVSVAMPADSRSEKKCELVC